MLIYIRHIFYLIFVVISINACDTKKEVTPKTETREKITNDFYLIANDKNDKTNLFGPVKYLENSFVDKVDRSINTSLYKVYPFLTVISYRNDYQFDKYGHTLIFKSREVDEFPFYDGIKYFDYKPNKSLTINNLEKEYSMHIKYPNQVNFDYKRVSSNTLKKGERKYDRFYHYKYEYNNKGQLIKQQAFQKLFGSDFYYKDTVIVEENSYQYKNDRIVSKISIFDKNNPESTYASKKIYNQLVTKRVPLNEDFEYDDKGRIIKWMFYQGNRSLVEHNYIYDDNDKLQKKIEWDFQSTDDRRVVNDSYKAIILFDKYENITRVDRVHSSGDTLNTQYIEYFKFDHYNNWTEKRIYLDGDKKDKGEVSIIATRELTYYEE